MKLSGKWFYGHEISPYGQEHGYLDYWTLSKAINHVMANDLMAKTDGVLGWWEPTSYGGYEAEVFQWFIVDEAGADVLSEIGEVVFYNSKLDLYLWGVTHCGTSWDYVLTDVPCNVGY